MATTEKNLEELEQQEQQAQEQQEQQAATPSARERYRSRYAEENPDLNLDDEEAFYAKANENLDELDDYRQSNKELGEAMDKAPILAGIILAAKKGVNPFAYLAENIGPDMDIRALAEDPEFAAQMGEALKKWQKQQDDIVARNKEVGENVMKSVKTLKDLQAEKGLSDEECVKMINDFFGEADEEGNPVGKASFMQNAKVGIVTKGMWESLINGRHYDDDIATATEKARAAALNERVQNNLKTFDAGVPTLSGGGGAAREQKKTKSISGFKEFGTDEL